MPLLGNLNSAAVTTQSIPDLHKICALESKSCRVFLYIKDVENLITHMGLEWMLQDDETAELSGANNVHTVRFG